ncbi:MAG: hypothetical protein H6707_12095 [Deltaproteobacteria bacterium]|nr:hypothetical protein [Deltaproteobacteria bacterium]
MSDKPQDGALVRRTRSLPSASQQLANLIDRPDAAQYIAALHPLALHRIIARVGLNDAVALLELCEPEQIQDVVDLQVWQRDRIEADELIDWLFALTQLSDDKRLAITRALDIELLSFVLASRTKIFLLEEDGEQAELHPGLCWPTPDGWFAIVIDGDEEQAFRLVRLLEQLYADDIDFVRPLLLNLRYELPTELEENAYRWRSGRLADLGFADPQDALALYAYLDPSSVERTERSAWRPPRKSIELLPVLPNAPAGSFWELALQANRSKLDPDALNRQLLTLANYALSADQIDPSDEEGATQSMTGLYYRLSLGLEHLCEGDPQAAGSALENIALIRLARLGHSLAVDLRRQLMSSVRSGRFGRTAGQLDLIEQPLQRQLSAMLPRIPRFYAPELGQRRHFESLADIATARAAIARAEAMAVLVPRDSWLPLGEDTTLGDIFRTLVVNDVLDREGPLDEQALAEAIELVQQAADQCVVAAHELAFSRLHGSRTKALPSPYRELVADWLEQLIDELSALDANDFESRYVGALVIDREL